MDAYTPAEGHSTHEVLTSCGREWYDGVSVSIRIVFSNALVCSIVMKFIRGFVVWEKQPLMLIKRHPIFENSPYSNASANFLGLEWYMLQVTRRHVKISVFFGIVECPSNIVDDFGKFRQQVRIKLIVGDRMCYRCTASFEGDMEGTRRKNGREKSRKVADILEDTGNKLSVSKEDGILRGY